MTGSKVTVRLVAPAPHVHLCALRLLREAWGLTQAAVARCRGIDQGTWSRIERGVQSLSLPVLHAVVTCDCGNTMAEFFALSEAVEVLLVKRGIEIVDEWPVPDFGASVVLRPRAIHELVAADAADLVALRGVAQCLAIRDVGAPRREGPE